MQQKRPIRREHVGPILQATPTRVVEASFPMADDADVYAELKTRIAEFAAIAKDCPDNLQEKCFELLLTDYLDRKPQAGPSAPRFEERVPTPESETIPTTPSLPTGQEDIALPDVHVRARRFLERYNVTVEDVNQVFYKEGDQILPLYEDLKTTKASECQIRIALMLAFRSAINSGEFVFNGETVRAECQTRKCYDQPNFVTNFRRNGDLFDAFTGYERNAPEIRLSENGRKALADLIKVLR